jgi:hypothetical protein
MEAALRAVAVLAVVGVGFDDGFLAVQGVDE